ncbi:hypothetical protein [Corynebacterium pseudogenitalium]|uniref:hypothetical protein n=1 Tax=Corynebacterium pseudogenitalium TaxID=38303 RepID=UPI00210D26C8|nr:hypothetical protein [Corynebacterium pseudogenitalium]MCQ4608355.1 hypothetical protein [Corynebacterium pseudogenitalium]
MPKSKYNKPFLEIEDQISLLEERGMSFKENRTPLGDCNRLGTTDCRDIGIRFGYLQRKRVILGRRILSLAPHLKKF